MAIGGPDSNAVAGRGKVWLSILTPVFNVEPYLAACLQSISSQMTDGVEVILLDDRSTDGSPRLCAEFCERSRGAVRLFSHKENRGVGASRNALLESAAGDYVWYVDSDDMILPGTVARLHEIIRTHAPDMILGDYLKKSRWRSSFAGASNELKSDRADLVRGVFANRRLHLWSKVCRRSLWGNDLRFPDVRCFEDVAVTPWLLLRARTYYHDPQPWIFYRVRPQSLTGLVSRTAGVFRERDNDDLASALRGYAAAVRELMPTGADATYLAIAHFCAKEFTKISARLLGARLFRDDCRGLRRRLTDYRATLEACSPVPFGDLLAAYRRRGRIDRWLVLKLFVLLSARRDQ